MPFGGTIHRELLFLSKAVEEEATEPADDFSRGLAERAGVFRLHTSVFLGLFPLLEQLDARWRRGIFRGEAGFDLAQGPPLRLCFEAWVRTSDPMRQRMEFYARHTSEPQSDAVETLERYSQKATQILASWQTPTLARCKALRIRYVSREEAIRLGFSVE